MSRCFTGDGRSRLWEVKAGIFVYSKILTVLMDNLNVLQVMGGQGCDSCILQDSDSGDRHFKMFYR